MKQSPVSAPVAWETVTRMKEFLGNNRFRSQKEVVQLSVMKAAILTRQQQAGDVT